MFPSRCFDSLSGDEVRFGVEESQFVEECHLSPIPGEGGLQPIVASNPLSQLGKVLFLAMSSGGQFFCLCRQVLVTDGVVRYCFSSGLCSWLS